MADKINKPTGKVKRKASVPANETKAQKFSRLASARTSKALKAIRNIGNLSGSSYEYTPDQANKIVAALNGAVKTVAEKLTAPKGSKSDATEFTV